MGKLTCQRCGATSEGATFEEADALIDHAIGQSKGRPCGGKESDLVWDGKTVINLEVETESESDSSKTNKKSSKRR